MTRVPARAAPLLGLLAAASCGGRETRVHVTVEGPALAALDGLAVEVRSGGATVALAIPPADGATSILLPARFGLLLAGAERGPVEVCVGGLVGTATVASGCATDDVRRGATVYLTVTLGDGADAGGGPDAGDAGGPADAGPCPTDCSALSDECHVGRCVGGSCIADPFVDGKMCDDGLACTTVDACSGGVCVGMGPPEGPAGDPTCSDGADNDCDGEADLLDTNCCDTSCTTCAGGCCTPSCGIGGSCMLGCPAGTCACAADCRYAALCDVSCPDGCYADCFLGTCTVLCGDFETCEADCASADYCAVTCGAGGACDVDCQGATQCAVWCLSGGGNSAACLLDCAGSPTCGFADCPSGAVSCPGGVLACNTACP